MDNERVGKNAMRELFSYLKAAQLCTNTMAYPITGQRKWIVRNGEPWPEKALEEGLYPYVVLPNGEIRLTALPRPKGKLYNPQETMHHPELVGGKDVIAAGMIRVNEVSGRKTVTYISNESGHYRPGQDSVHFALHAFRFWRVPLAEDVEVDYSWILTSNI